MPARFIVTLSGLLLAALALPAWTESPRDKQPKLHPAVTALVELAKASEAGKDLSKSAKAILQRHDLDEIKQALRQREKGGVGVGKWQQGKANGIESKLLILARRDPTAAQLKAESADLLKMTHVLIASAEVTKVGAPNYNSSSRRKRYLQDCDEMKGGSLDLLKAVKDSDTKATRKAALRIQNACSGCHSRLTNADR
jgi:hypothetical protein